MLIKKILTIVLLLLLLIPSILPVSSLAQVEAESSEIALPGL